MRPCSGSCVRPALKVAAKINEAHQWRWFACERAGGRTLGGQPRLAGRQAGWLAGWLATRFEFARRQRERPPVWREEKTRARRRARELLGLLLISRIAPNERQASQPVGGPIMGLGHESREGVARGCGRSPATELAGLVQRLQLQLQLLLPPLLRCRVHAGGPQPNQANGNPCAAKATSRPD